MAQAYSLDWFSSEQDKRRVYVPAHLLGNLSTTWERARISDDMIQFIIIDGLEIGRVWDKLVKENRWQDFHILWSHKDTLVGRPKY